MDANERFRTNLRRERERQGLSHRAFARKAGASGAGFTTNLESGRRGVTLATVQKAADTLGVDPVSLLRPVEGA